MPVISVDGHKVAVDDGFLKMSPEDQNATVDEIAASFKSSSAPKPDKYQQAAIDEQVQLKAAGGDEGAGFTRRLAHGATLGADSTILAALTTPLEMAKRGVGPSEAYNYAKAREDQIMGDARQNTGALGTATEVLGGGVSGAGLANGGVTAARFLAPEAGLVARSGAAAADAAGLGAFSGAMEGNGLQERGMNALKGGATGAVVGGATPGAMGLLGGIASPVVSNLRARFNPEGFAQSQVARAIHESGVTPQQAALDTIQAANEGQGMFTLADAMGNSGQRMLSTVARAPGEGRTAVVNALEDRQAGQGRRLSNALSEGFQAPQTAAQTEAGLTRARDTAANAEYGVIRNDAVPVDVVGTINHLDNIIGTGPGQQLQTPNDSVETILRAFRERLSRVNPDDFAAVQRIRGDMSDAAQNAMQSGYGNRSRLIRGAIGQLDTAMENASTGHLQANRNFAQASRNIEAVDQGRAAAMRGRTEDTIPAFQNLGPEGQQAFRAGYVDPLIAQTQGAAFGVNKARPLVNNAFQDEAAAMAPGNDLMQRRITREQTMFETRNHALGGSRTADNLNDHAAAGVDPHLVGQILSGNWHGAVRSILSAGSNAVSGNTPEVRQEIANILLQNGQSIAPRQLQRMVDDTIQRIQFVQNIARSAGRGAAGGLAVANPTQSHR